MTTTRRTITAAEKAQAALDVAVRRLTKARDERDRLREALVDAEGWVMVAEKRRDYLAQDPDLPPAQTHTDAQSTDQA